MDMIKVFQQLHRHPEIGYTEAETTKTIREILTDAGIEILQTGLPTGLVAVVRGKTNKKSVCLRADIDALPIVEQTGLPYASEHPGIMHACGHDFHTVCALETALRLQACREELNGDVYFAFEAAEELPGGAEAVVATGVFGEVREFFAIHGDPDRPVGQVGIKEGSVMAAFDKFEIRVNGVGTHAATPHLGKNPIPVLVSIVQALQSFATASLSPSSKRVLSVTQLCAGQTWNVIPEYASCVGTVRTLDEQDRKQIREAIERIVSQHGLMTGTDCRLLWTPGSPCVVNTALLCERARAVASEVGLTPVDFVPELLSDDFAFFATKTPNASGLYIKVGTGKGYPLHHPKFQVDLSVLQPTATFLTALLKKSVE